jgi:hypothetical protein
MRPLPGAAMMLPVTADRTAIISLREAGNMRRPEPLRRLLAAVGLPPARVCRVAQVHSRRVVAAPECRRLAPPGRGPRPAIGERWAASRADGLTAGPDSAAAGVALMVTAADCVPILMAAPGGAYALLHSGWRGTGIAAAAVHDLRHRYGADPASLTVVLGPAIGPCCYNVDEQRYRLFRDRYGAAAVRTGRDGTRYLDLLAANTVLLRRLGVRDIRATPACTSCQPLLHSSRRDGRGLMCELMAVLLLPVAAGHCLPSRSAP